MAPVGPGEFGLGGGHLRHSQPPAAGGFPVGVVFRQPGEPCFVHTSPSCPTAGPPGVFGACSSSQDALRDVPYLRPVPASHSIPERRLWDHDDDGRNRCRRAYPTGGPASKGRHVAGGTLGLCRTSASERASARELPSSTARVAVPVFPGGCASSGDQQVGHGVRYLRRVWRWHRRRSSPRRRCGDDAPPLRRFSRPVAQ